MIEIKTKRGKVRELTQTLRNYRDFIDIKIKRGKVRELTQTLRNYRDLIFRKIKRGKVRINVKNMPTVGHICLNFVPMLQTLTITVGRVAMALIPELQVRQSSRGD